ncbi:uncharacterized protein LOC115230293 isoform X2 [Octopus sinensis]|uniref:Uncharacterized protein LOC115230293 isoform X2 n=1 Tax=Octopus sinensis TaxID=2607531 RepID=A0A6P7U269_9MOLL|nr:uncharacterized protein LOC115230293 isoform X2 [Octopus sinensis]
MADSGNYEKILFIHSADGEDWSKYLQEMLLTEYKISSDNTQYKDICDTHFNNYLIKVLIFTPLMEEEDKVSATLKNDTLSLYVLLHCSVDIEQSVCQYKKMNIVYTKEIDQVETTVRNVLENIIELHESYFDHYEEIDEKKLPFRFFPNTFYPGQNTLFIGFNEQKDTTYSIKISECPDSIPVFQCAENIGSCTLPQCKPGHKTVQLFDDKRPEEQVFASNILIITTESLVNDIFEYYRSCKSPNINYRGFTKSKNIFKGLHNFYQGLLSDIVKDSLNVSETEDDKAPPLPERKQRIYMRPPQNPIPEIRARNSRNFNYQKLINRQKISSYLDNIVPPILPDRINGRP